MVTTRTAARAAAWLVALSLPVAIAACSGSSRSSDGQAETGAAGGSENESYPNLARVPTEPPRPTSEELRQQLIEGLVADHANARYTEEPLTAQSAGVPPAAPPPGGRTQVEILWDSPRVPTEADLEAEEESRREAEEPEAPGERVEITWDTPRVEPEMPAAPQDEPLEVSGGPELVGVIYFPEDSTDLERGDQDLLREVIALYKERGGRIRLVGHSKSKSATGDTVGQQMVDLDLSLKRANAVADTLVDLGVKQDALMVEAKGDPGASAQEAAISEAEARRVEIFLEE